MPSKIKKAKSIGAVVFNIINGKPKYLILKHCQIGKHWGFIKGEQNKNESKFDTLKRELNEETDIKSFKIIPSFKRIENYSFIHNGIKTNKKVTYFLSQIKQKKIVLSEEHSDYLFGSFEKILKKLEHDETKNVLINAHLFLIRGGFIKRKKKGRVLFVSFPKAGRTWIAFLISKIIQRRYGFPKEYAIDIEKMSSFLDSIDDIYIIHEDNPHKKKKTELLTSKKDYKPDKIILLVRDPRDMIVSFYFHQSRRKYSENYKKSLSEFLYEPVGSFGTLIEYYNIWEKNRFIPKDFLLIKYEEFSRNTKKEVKKILNFIGVKNISNQIINDAIKFSSFENMHKMESENRFGVKRLKPGNKNDPDSFKVRRGKIGGYKDYLKKREIYHLNKKMRGLSSFYGYNI